MNWFKRIFAFAGTAKQTAEAFAEADKQFNETANRVEETARRGAQTAQTAAKNARQTKKKVEQFAENTRKRAKAIGEQVGTYMGEMERGVNEFNGMVKHAASKIPAKPFSPSVQRMIDERKRERGL